MFTKFHKAIGLSLIAGLTPVMFAITPVAAADMPTAVAAQVQTQAQPGTNVATAGAPMSGWVTIPANGTQWYKFRYQYDNTTTGNTPSQAIVQLQMKAAGTVNFAVWTPGSLQNPVHNPKDKNDHTNDKVQPVGVGTVVNLGSVKSVIGYHDTNNNATSGSDTNDAFLGQNQQALRSDVPQPLVTDKKGDVLNPQILTWVGGATASDTYYVAVHNNTNAPVSYQLAIGGPTVSFPQ